MEWKEKWLLVTGEQYKNAIPKPVLSRWEHVGSAAQHIKQNLGQWEAIAIAIAVANTKSSEVGLIANQLLQLISLPLIVAHIHLVCAYDDSFFQKHFDYLKKRDSISKLHGFNARNMPLHAYIMYRDLKYISGHWRDMVEFKTFVDAFNLITEQPHTMQYLVHNFISLAIDRYTKHFNQWWTTNLPLAIAGKSLLATRLVCWFLEKSQPPLPSIHLPSKEHRTTLMWGNVFFLQSGRTLHNISTIIYLTPSDLH